MVYPSKKNACKIIATFISIAIIICTAIPTPVYAKIGASELEFFFKTTAVFKGANTPLEFYIEYDDYYTLNEGEDYLVSYQNNNKVGTASITVYGIGEYSFSVTRNFSILPKDINECENLGLLDYDSYYSWRYPNYGYTYTGKEITPKVNPYHYGWDGYNEVFLTEGVDYTLSYVKNLNVGEASVIVTGIGNYTGTYEEYFDIECRPIYDPYVTITGIKDVTYNPENNYTQNVSVKCNGITLKKDKDYTVSLYAGDESGEVLVSGIGNFTDGKYISFRINPADISKANVTGIKNVKYTGYKITQDPVVNYNGTILDDYEYNISYKNNLNCGTATMTITGDYHFKGSISKTFKINHNLKRIAAKAATCTKAGNKEYWQCTGCKKVFSDSKGTTETTIAAMTIKAKGHKLTKTAAKSATCAKAGNKEYYTCSICKKLFSDSKGTKATTKSAITIKATGKHTWDKGKITKQATVTATGVKTYTCTVCKKTKTETIPKVKVTTIGLRRVYGGSRYTTSFAIAEEYMKDSGQKKLNNIIVACGTNFPDALAASYLSKVKKAPIIVWNKGNNGAVQNFIKKNVNKGGKVYLLGGAGVVGDAVKSNMSGYTFKRLYDSTRYGTNLKILNEAGIKQEELLVCDGTKFVNALIASGTGKPILLVPKGGLNTLQKTWLRNNKSKITKATIIGDAASVDLDVEIDLEAYINTVERVSAKNADVMSSKIAKRYFSNPEEAVVAISENFPDGLCGGPLAIANKGPVLLVTDESYKYSAEFVSQKPTIKRTTVLGGPGLVSDSVVKKIARNSNAKWTVIKK